MVQEKRILNHALFAKEQGFLSKTLSFKTITMGILFHLFQLLINTIRFFFPKQTIHIDLQKTDYKSEYEAIHKPLIASWAFIIIDCAVLLFSEYEFCLYGEDYTLQIVPVVVLFHAIVGIINSFLALGAYHKLNN
jgi:hypothetical protein